MALPARHQHGALQERGFPWREPLAAEFEEFFERMHHFLETATPSWPARMAWAPSADLHETDDAYVVECELPGLRREEIDVEISERELHISGEMKEREREGVLRRTTRNTGRFEYRATLPTQVRSKDVSASLVDGILTVTVPKAQPAKPHHVEIQT